MVSANRCSMCRRDIPPSQKGATTFVLFKGKMVCAECALKVLPEEEIAKIAGQNEGASVSAAPVGQEKSAAPKTSSPNMAGVAPQSASTAKTKVGTSAVA